MWMRLKRSFRIYSTKFMCYGLGAVILSGHFFLQNAILPQLVKVHGDSFPASSIRPGLAKSESVAAAMIPLIRKISGASELNEDSLGEEIKKSEGSAAMHPAGLKGLLPTAPLNLSYNPNHPYMPPSTKLPSANHTLLATEKEAMDNSSRSRIHYYYNEGASLPDPKKDDHVYIFNCTNVHHINIKRKLGHGVSKQVMLGTYNNRKVGVKMVTRSVLDVTACVKKVKRENGGTISDDERNKCFVFPNMKLMKEILLLQQLQHPNLLKMLGYCVRSEETLSTSLQEHGIVAVYEYALRFYLSTIRTWPMHLRLKTAYELADLLEYMENSPLGSLRIADFKDAHFLLKDGKIKLTDLDDVSSIEPSCIVDEKQRFLQRQNPSKQERRCKFGLKCIGGICPGHNAKANLDNMNRLFFSNLLGMSNDAEPSVNQALMGITNQLNRLTVTARDVKDLLTPLLNVPYEIV